MGNKEEEVHCCPISMSLSLSFKCNLTQAKEIKRSQRITQTYKKYFQDTDGIKNIYLKLSKTNFAFNSIS